VTSKLHQRESSAQQLALNAREVGKPAIKFGRPGGTGSASAERNRASASRLRKARAGLCQSARRDSNFFGVAEKRIVHLSTFCYNAAQRCMPCGGQCSATHPGRSCQSRQAACGRNSPWRIAAAAECAQHGASVRSRPQISMHPDRGPEVKEVRASYSRFRWLCRSVQAPEGALSTFFGRRAKFGEPALAGGNCG
jgi:hypothetical protein